MIFPVAGSSIGLRAGASFSREVGPHLMVVGEIAGQDAAEVSLAEDEHVI
jgi:hypothetical protein